MKKTLAIILVAIIAVSAFSAVAVVSARPFMNWKNVPHGNAYGWWNRHSQQTSTVRFNADIEQWGTTEVNGSLHAQTRTLVINDTDMRQSASVTAMWTTNNTRPINALRAKENFTYIYNTARLVELNVTALDVDGNDLFLNGTWTVYEITSTFNIYTDADGNITGFHRSQDGVVLASQAYGELIVTGTWESFTLDIDGVDTLTGSILNQRIISRLCNPFKINIDNGDILTNADIAGIANAYGAMPGWGNYNQNMDYNFDYKIDICDLTTATANINT